MRKFETNRALFLQAWNYSLVRFSSVSRIQPLVSRIRGKCLVGSNWSPLRLGETPPFKLRGENGSHFPGRLGNERTNSRRVLQRHEVSLFFYGSIVPHLSIFFFCTGMNSQRSWLSELMKSMWNFYYLHYKKLPNLRSFFLEGVLLIYLSSLKGNLKKNWM